MPELSCLLPSCPRDPVIRTELLDDREHDGRVQHLCDRHFWDWIAKSLRQREGRQVSELAARLEHLLERGELGTGPRELVR